MLAAVAFAAGLRHGALRDSEAESAATRLRRGLGGARLRRDVAAAHAGRRRARRRRRSSPPPTREALGTATGTRDRRRRRRARRATARAWTSSVRHAHLRRRSRATLSLPVEDGRIDWAPHLVFPGPAPGRRRCRARRPRPPRAKILARDGSTLVEGPASARVSPLGAAGAEIAGVAGRAGDRGGARRALRARVRAATRRSASRASSGSSRSRWPGTPGGQLRAGTRVLAGVRAAGRRAGADDDRRRRPGGRRRPRWPGASAASRRSTPAPRAVRGARRHRVLGPAAARARRSRSSPRRRRSRRSSSSRAPSSRSRPRRSSTASSSRTRTASRAAAASPRASPTRATRCSRRSASGSAPRSLVETAERYGFNEDPALPGAAPSTLPAADEIASPLELGATAIGQGRVLATPLRARARWRRRSRPAACGARRRSSAAARAREPVRVTSREVARTLERLMVGVVDYGTGTAASLAPIGVAGKTGTAELEDTTDEEDDVEQTPGSDTDAWFTAYAPVQEAEARGGGAAGAQRRGRRDGGAGGARRAAGRRSARLEVELDEALFAVRRGSRARAGGSRRPRAGTRTAASRRPSGPAGRGCPSAGMHSPGSSAAGVVVEDVLLVDLERLVLVALRVDHDEVVGRLVGAVLERRRPRRCGCTPGGRRRRARSRASPPRPASSRGRPGRLGLSSRVM